VFGSDPHARSSVSPTGRAGIRLGAACYQLQNITPTRIFQDILEVGGAEWVGVSFSTFCFGIAFSKTFSVPGWKQHYFMPNYYTDITKTLFCHQNLP
jgi:hypothetical protein